MKTSDFSYDLPSELIAQHPLEKRDASRLLCLGRHTGDISHDSFSSLPELLRSGDCLVFNDSRVLPARLLGTRPKGGAVEVLLLRDRGGDRWECLVKPGRKCPVGTVIMFGEGQLCCKVEELLSDGKRLIRFEYSGIFAEILAELGETPLPPYIREKLIDSERYQTVYAKIPGSAAAPTAGLHFTGEIIRKLEDMGVITAFVTLHVGLGTFRPVKAESITDHIMHEESFSISEASANRINSAREAGGRIIAVGTTSCRVLESSADDNGYIRPCETETGIFIYPGYRFKAIDGLLTNFHLPESTLLMLVSAFAGKENVLRAYGEAVRERYRFFSFGDAMLIL